MHPRVFSGNHQISLLGVRYHTWPVLVGEGVSHLTFPRRGRGTLPDLSGGRGAPFVIYSVMHFMLPTPTLWTDRQKPMKTLPSPKHICGRWLWSGYRLKGCVISNQRRKKACAAFWLVCWITFVVSVVNSLWDFKDVVCKNSQMKIENAKWILVLHWQFFSSWSNVCNVILKSCPSMSTALINISTILIWIRNPEPTERHDPKCQMNQLCAIYNILLRNSYQMAYICPHPWYTFLFSLNSCNENLWNVVFHYTKFVRILIEMDVFLSKLWCVEFRRLNKLMGRQV